MSTKTKFPKLKSIPSKAVLIEAAVSSERARSALSERTRKMRSLRDYANLFFKQNPTASEVVFLAVRFSSGAERAIIESPGTTTSRRSTSLNSKNPPQILARISCTREKVHAFRVGAHTRLRMHVQLNQQVANQITKKNPLRVVAKKVSSSLPSHITLS